MRKSPAQSVQVLFPAVICLAFLYAQLASAEAPAPPFNVVVLESGDLFVPAAFVQDRTMRETVTAGTRNTVNFYLEALHEQHLSQTAFDERFEDALVDALRVDA